MSTDDIDIIAGTRRRAIVTKVLRDRYNIDIPLGNHVAAAKAVLLALDEDDSEREITGAETDQLVRMAAAQAVSLCRDAEELTVNEYLAAVDRVAAYIRDGKVGE